MGYNFRRSLQTTIVLLVTTIPAISSSLFWLSRLFLCFLFWIEGGPAVVLPCCPVRPPEDLEWKGVIPLLPSAMWQRSRQDCWTGVVVVVKSKLSVSSVTLLEEEVQARVSGRWVRGSSPALGLSVNDREAPSNKYNTFSRHAYYYQHWKSNYSFWGIKLLQPSTPATTWPSN